MDVRGPLEVLLTFKARPAELRKSSAAEAQSIGPRLAREAVRGRCISE